MQKQIGIVFGGRSTEHQVSVMSAKNIYKSIDRDKFIPVLIFIDPKGRWFKVADKEFVNDNFNKSQECGINLELNQSQGSVINLSNNESLKLDAIFPVLHGPNGEDGSVQGLFKIAGIPFVGSGILSSSVAMDKDVAKRLFIEAKLSTAKYLCFRKWEVSNINFTKVSSELGLPLVIKPSRAGSSVGITKVKNETEFKNGLNNAFQFDSKVLIEEYIEGREIECAVLGNEDPIASVPGEIITEFYDYEAKYISKTKAKLEAPAKLENSITEEVKGLAIKVYKVLECEGMARVDFFLTKKKLLINEINTIPGFTDISMYPTLFSLSGISNKDLITKLIELAIDRFNKNQNLETFYDIDVK